MGRSPRRRVVRYGSVMSTRLGTVRHRYRSRLRAPERRMVRVLVWSSVVCLAGVSVTGAWQFVRHQSDSAWYLYERGSGSELTSSSSEGVAELHSIFAMATAVVALVGGAWLAYRVLVAVHWSVVATLAVSAFGWISGSVMVTSRFELGTTAFRIWTTAHVLTLPILLAVIWLGLPTTDDEPNGSGEI